MLFRKQNGIKYAERIKQLDEVKSGRERFEISPILYDG
jgi:hypothetical protein